MDVKLNQDAREDFLNLDTRQKAGFQEEKKNLKAWPATSGAKPLENRWKGHFRLVLCKDWRVLFRVLPGTVEPDHITVVRLRHRSVAYL